MDDITKKKVWGKPSAGVDKAGPNTLEHRERRYSILYNLLTVLLTGVIITGGILLPTLLYPYLDQYHSEVVQLVDPSENSIAEHTFDKPLVLYPWDIYDEKALRQLTSSERDLLDERGIPDFLIANLLDRGMEGDLNRTIILGAFRYLEPSDSVNPGCFVLYDADIDADGQSDLRCAVDLQFNIIDLLFLNSDLGTLVIDAPIGVLAAAPPGETQSPDGTTQPPDGTPGTTPNNNPPDSSDTTGGGGAVSTNGTAAGGNAVTEGEETSGTTGTTGTPATAGTAGDNGSAGANEAAVSNPQIEYLPEDDRNLWSFIYATSREARVYDQQTLMRTFRQLDLSFETRFGYPYTMLLPIQPAEPEEFPDDAPPLQTPPAPFRTTDYLLNVYDLASSDQLILYLDPDTLHCMGFTILKY